MSRALPEGRDGLLQLDRPGPGGRGLEKRCQVFAWGFESTVAMIRKQTWEKSAIEVA